ncbi:MAG: molecular chaperone TorD family protein [Deltaproteobacteria bacterium]|nr:molecular chaperone TorD family protein [Deltaproteobacteria bacterium]
MGVYDQEQGAARENLCRFLAACYYQPGPEYAEEKVFDSMLDAATRIHPDLAMHARRLGEEFSAEGPDSLLVDYTRLFLGPADIVAKPYGSVWLDGEKTLMRDSTMAVQELYHEGGFEIDEDFRELPDHIAAELEFLYLLIYRENEARRNDNPGALTAMAGLRKHFLDEHLGSWVGPFTAAVKAGAQSGFYRELAELTGRFVKMEASEDKAA